MTRHLLTTASVLVIMLPLTFSALGQDQAPPRTTWEKADPTSDKVIRWVVEGCAAYPVTVDALPEDAGADETADIAAQSGQIRGDR